VLTGVLKSYKLSPKYQPKKLYPSLTGSSGAATGSPFLVSTGSKRSLSYPSSNLTSTTLNSVGS